MYWLRSIFIIGSITDLKFLSNLYNSVTGELTVEGHLEISIKWTTNPFQALLNHPLFNSLNAPFNITSRLVGPQTVMAISTSIQKLDKGTFTHPNIDNILIWADFIDENLSYEMNRRNDMARIFTRPSIDLSNKNELLLAASLSKYALFALSGKNGFIFSHPEICYLSWFGVTKNDDCNTALMFDKDDGFTNLRSNGPWSSADDEDESMTYLNKIFLEWKNNGYSGNLCDFCKD